MNKIDFTILYCALKSMVEEPPNMLISLTKNFMNVIGIRPPRPQLDITRLCNFYPMDSSLKGIVVKIMEVYKVYATLRCIFSSRVTKRQKNREQLCSREAMSRKSSSKGNFWLGLWNFDGEDVLEWEIWNVSNHRDFNLRARLSHNVY
ncbi:hypothetical protein ACFE04_001665 [Oxalis oulophora]